MSLMALPTAASSRKWLIWLLAPVVALLSMTAALSFRSGTGTAAPGAVGMFHRAVPIDLDVKIVKDGELQAINNIEIQSEVEGQTTIQTLVKEGTTVKKGDTLVTLDSSAIRQKIEDTYLEIQKAEADLTNAREMREIQISTNAANLEAAEVALTLAQLALKQYEEGTYPQSLANARTDLESAHTNLRNAQEKLGKTKALQSKGFVTMTQVKDDELLVINATNNVQKAETALKVLTEYTHQMELADKQNALSQSEQRVARVKRENAASMSQKDADVRAKDQALSVLKRRMERLEEQLAACTIKAPADGMVVYFTSGDRNAQNALQEGSQVRERQNLLRLPDTRSMKAVVRISESQVARLHEGQRATIQLSNLKEPIGATLTKISVLSDNSQRWWNPDLKEYPVDLELDQTPPSVKPGMGAMSTIYIERLQHVLAVPLTAIYSVGQQSWVGVRTRDDEFEPRQVKIGATNETHAQVLDGLSSGQEVKLLQAGEGQVMLEQAGINVAPTPTTQPDGDRAGANGRARPEGVSGMPPGMGQPNSTDNGQPGAEPGRRPGGERGSRGEGGGRRRPRPEGGDRAPTPDTPGASGSGSPGPGQ